MIDTAKLRKAMDDIAAKKGAFLLFGLFLRADSPLSWDLVVSAPWLEEGKPKALRELVRLLSESLGKDALSEFSRVVTLNRDDPAFEAIVSAFAVDDGELRVQHRSVNGLEIEDAIVLTAKPTVSGAA